MNTPCAVDCHAGWLDAGRRRGRAVALACAVVLVCVTAMSCAPKEEKPLPPPPPAAYRGPEFLRGSIGAVATLEGYRPLLVSGYGIVAGLNGTGSPDCPASLRPYILDMITKGGIGRYDTGTKATSPERFLASMDTAVVMVEGVIPPGATRGSRFDLLVTALPQTSTSSLEDGNLYSLDLRPGGLDLSRPSLSNMARAHGAVFLNPFAEDAGKATDERPPEQRIGYVLGGGVVDEETPLQLITTQPSYRLTRQIADRINSRFPPEPNDLAPIADPKTNVNVAIRVPKSFQGDSQRMLDLLSHLFLNPSTEFTQAKAHELADLIKDPKNQQYADDIAYTWEALGTSILPVIRELYVSDDLTVKLTALTAGARLVDLRSIDGLIAVAKGGHGPRSVLATTLLGQLLQKKPENIRLARTLREMLDEDDAMVRVAAYEGLAACDDSSIRRFGFKDKMELAQVSCRKPLIYVSRAHRPRVVVFGDRLGFAYPPAPAPLLFTIWDNHFMLRGEPGADKVSLFYHGARMEKPVKADIPSNVGYLAGVMAFEPDPDSDSKAPGLGMSYSRVVTALYQMSKSNIIDAPFKVEQDDLIQKIKRGRITDTGGQRPETTNDLKTSTPSPATAGSPNTPATPTPPPAPASPPSTVPPAPAPTAPAPPPAERPESEPAIKAGVQPK